MEQILPLASQIARARWLPRLAVALVMLVLAGIVTLGTLELRKNIILRMVERNAEILDAAASLEMLGVDTPADLMRQIDDATGQLTLALRLSRLQEDVLAVRIYDAQGRFVVSMPNAVRPRALPEASLRKLQSLTPVSDYQPEASLDGIFLSSEVGSDSVARQAAILSVFLPLHDRNQHSLLAVAELVQDASVLRSRFQGLDRQLVRQAILAFVTAGGIVGLVLTWSFHRLGRLTGRLEQQANDLRRANMELTLAAKTSALGGVAAHLVHGLASPLNGLQMFMAERAGQGDNGWQHAMQGTERMQALLDDVVRVLAEDGRDAIYEMPLGEAVQVVAGRIAPLAQAGGVKFEYSCLADGQMTNRDTNLVLLILENLLQNAVQATPSGRTVRLLCLSGSQGPLFEVRDEGAGIPAKVVEQLFVPTRSSKPGGNGLGLAISHHLARHLGAELKLKQTSQSGSVFVLELVAAPANTMETAAGVGATA